MQVPGYPVDDRFFPVLGTILRDARWLCGSFSPHGFITNRKDIYLHDVMEVRGFRWEEIMWEVNRTGLGGLRSFHKKGDVLALCLPMHKAGCKRSAAPAINFPMKPKRYQRTQ